MTNYSRGRAREYQAIRILRDEGWVCTRSAMSHGPVDIIAARKGKVMLIQVKSGSARAKKAELELLRLWALEFKAAAEIWSFKKRGNIKKITIAPRRPRKIGPIASPTISSQPVAPSPIAIPQILPASVS